MSPQLPAGQLLTHLPGAVGGDAGVQRHLPPPSLHALCPQLTPHFLAGISQPSVTFDSGCLKTRPRKQIKKESPLSLTDLLCRGRSPRATSRLRVRHSPPCPGQNLEVLIPAVGLLGTQRQSRWLAAPTGPWGWGAGCSVGVNGPACRPTFISALSLHFTCRLRL